MSSKIIAQVTLRSPEGWAVGEVEESITSKNVAKYEASETTVREARRKLEAAGFEVVQESPFSLSIEGEKEQFERIFQTDLEAEGSRERRPASTFYRATRPATVPEEMTDVVADVSFPVPPELFP